MVHIFHFLPTSLVFEIVNPFSGIFNAISREKTLHGFNAFLDLWTLHQDTRIFPFAESWIPRASRMQSGFTSAHRILSWIAASGRTSSVLKAHFQPRSFARRDHFSYMKNTPFSLQFWNCCYIVFDLPNQCFKSSIKNRMRETNYRSIHFSK